MYRSITIARQYGSGGARIAHLLATRVGWKLLDRALIQRIAAAAKVRPEVVERLDESVDSWLYRLGKLAFAHGGFDSISHPDAAGIFDAETLVRFSRTIIEEAASIGRCVIVGRGAQCILRGRPDTLQIFIYAPLEERIRRVRARMGEEGDALAQIESVDRMRATYVRQFFHEDRLSPDLYHLMINSSLGEETAVSAIQCALSHGSAPEPEAGS
jgi:cytidylate kinase